jgi:hypothetical protein
MLWKWNKQIRERLLAKMGAEMKEEMETNGEKTDANQEEMKAKIEVSS